MEVFQAVLVKCVTVAKESSTLPGSPGKLQIAFGGLVLPLEIQWAGGIQCINILLSCHRACRRAQRVSVGRHLSNCPL